MANGRVIIGFSKPYVAKYVNTSGVITYEDKMPLARGVSVSIQNDDPEEATFYADNGIAEKVVGSIKSGTVTLTVDGLKADAESFIYGLPEADSSQHLHYGASINPPYVGIGFIVEWISDDVKTYQALVIRKAKFKMPTISANTMGDSIDFQTQELEATFLCDDSANKVFRTVGKECASEALAIADLDTILA